MQEIAGELKFVWLWRWYRFRGMNVLVIRKRQSQTTLEGDLRRSQGLPPLPDTITYRDPLGLENDVSELTFIEESEPILNVERF